MVEGPGVHRVAIAHRKLLLGQRVKASSPNGKFRDGAALIDGQVLVLIEAHGKNIFYFFTCLEPANGNETELQHLPESVTVVHIHFGMSGSFQTYTAPGPEPRPATRLRLVAEKMSVVAHLSANVCNYGGLEFYRKKVECLGPDPLRTDGDKERLWANLQKSKKKIGAVLMDQSLVAGIGNIYRTELLFVIGLHPNQPASTLTRSTFEQLWSEAQRLLKVGMITGSIITVSQDEAGRPFSKLRKGEKRYIYNHKQCRRCNGEVESWKLAQRTIYACEACQPLMQQTSETQESYGTFGEHTTIEDNDKKIEKYVTFDGYSHHAKTSQHGILESTVVSQEQLKPKVRHRQRTVEHQAFKDITTGGLLDFGSQDDLTTLQNLAPTTPQKPSAAEAAFVAVFPLCGFLLSCCLTVPLLFFSNSLGSFRMVLFSL
ncbi:hypothetical protein GOP47_0022407 [Adiantum capillus-veneris]|uniref:DNA-(apurinic or apyrimidinic site) lyase n=1 Tax=Adiantum capillus-veneris TaxID=13818 RepID=A0A9D4Z483_ADICA|nr:hypothetical protein GOP47_0022407 [Adiantum capillus-veneris]